MTAIALDNIQKRFGGPNGVAVLQGLALTIDEGESYVLLGPSGCGKTTTLRMVAGLEEPSSGELTISGTPVYSKNRNIWVPPERRPIGMVFQSYALWPTMTVLENVSFTLTRGRTKLPSKEAAGRAASVLEMMQISHLAERRVMQLSGGQQQRVALARAIAQQPRILLMDEPLSNLDPQLRSDVRGEIRKLCKSLGITSVIVTHDRDDALGLADRVGVMANGKILQQAEPSHVMNRPRSLFIARLFGEVNTMPGRIESIEAGQARIVLADLAVTVPVLDWMAPGQSVIAGARPGEQHLTDVGLAGVVLESHLEGQLHRNKIEVPGGVMTIYHRGAAIAPGHTVHIATGDGAWLVFPA